MKRKLAWVCLLVSPLVIGGAAFCFWHGDSVTKPNCDKITEGMPLREVLGILGKNNLWPVRGEWGSIEFMYVLGSRGCILVTFRHPRMEPMQQMETPSDNPLVVIDDDYINRWGDTLFVRRASFTELEPETILEKIKKFLNF
jgi:hypothetical protein